MHAQLPIAAGLRTFQSCGSPDWREDVRLALTVPVDGHLAILTDLQDNPIFRCE